MIRANLVPAPSDTMFRAWALALLNIVGLPGLATAQSRVYQKWLSEDVGYILTARERAEFLSLFH
jgi:hypothetical protein